MLATADSSTRAERITAFIIDDENKARKNLHNLLSLYCPEIKVIGEASSLQDMADTLDHLKPAVLFQDICMPGDRGMKFVEQLKNRTQVIFVTAYQEYALRALKAGAVDYLLKPIRISDLQAAVKKLDALSGQGHPLPVRQKQPERMALPIQGGLEMISIRDILYIASDNSYSTVRTLDKTLMVSKSIGDFEEALGEEQFFRVHNSYLVNLDYVKVFSSTDGGRLQLTNGTFLPVAKRRYKDLKKAFFSFYKHFE